MEHQMMSIETRVLQGKRLTPQDGLFLLEKAPLHWLGQLATTVRQRRPRPHSVSFVIDTNPNYTNICDTDCQFCAFARHPQDHDAYTLSVEEVMKKIERVISQGVTTVLLQGGHNRTLPLEYYLSLVKETKRRFPHITPHFFSASEIQTMAGVAGLSTKEVLV